MVSPGTLLVKNHESQLKKTNPKLKMLGPLCNQTVNLKTDSKTLYYSTLKLKRSPSILKHNKGEKKYASFNNRHHNCHRNYMNNIVFFKTMATLVNGYSCKLLIKSTPE